MWPRLPRSDFGEQRGSGQQESHEAASRIQARRPACWHTRPAGRSRGALLAPRETYRALANSRILKPVDDQPVWSVVCFFAKPYRRRGLTARLLNEPAKHARRQGARIAEGYPVEPKAEAASPDAFVWTGRIRVWQGQGLRRRLAGHRRGLSCGAV